MAVWFVTGAARGMGQRVAREALRRGHRVAAAASDLAADFAGELLPLELDPSRPEAAVAQAMSRFGRIDVLVHDLATIQRAPLGETADAQVRAVFDVNVFGMLAVTRAVLPVLTSQQTGRIIVVGSAAQAGSGLHRASMAAVEALCEALRAELADDGVRVTVAELGRFNTVPAVFDREPHRPGDPRKAAAAIVDLLTVDDPPLRLQLGADAVAHVEAKLEQVAQELDRWRPVSLSTDIDHDDLSGQNGHRSSPDT